MQTESLYQWVGQLVVRARRIPKAQRDPLTLQTLVFDRCDLAPVALTTDVLVALGEALYDLDQRFNIGVRCFELIQSPREGYPLAARITVAYPHDILLEHHSPLWTEATLRRYWRLTETLEARKPDDGVVLTLTAIALSCRAPSCA